MIKGTLKQICIAPKAGAPMQALLEVYCMEGKGLQGDRYAAGIGSFNKLNAKKTGTWNGQVTLMNAHFFKNKTFWFYETRRNLLIEGIELMRCINKEFTIGDVKFFGYKYCEPCTRPSKLSNKPVNFAEEFFDCGGLTAHVLTSGIIKIGDIVLPPQKNY